MELKTAGIDLSKNTFHLYGVDNSGKCILRVQISRKKMLTYFANIPRCLIGIEACGGANFWQRKLIAQGHDVRQIAPQFVKPYVKTNKNDFNDAEGICEAVQRPNMRFVPAKSIAQQDIQCIHRARQQMVQRRRALGNEIRGFLAEYGLVIKVGSHNVVKELLLIIEDGENELTTRSRELFVKLKNEYQHILEAEVGFDKELKRIFEENELCQRISKIEGLGPVSSTAIVAAVGDANNFKNGRQMAAWLGLVPKQHSSGGKTVLLGISKRGDSYLRMLLIHGGRAALRWIMVRPLENLSPRQRIFRELAEKKGVNKAAVAMANKNARIIWAMMARNKEYSFSN